MTGKTLTDRELDERVATRVMGWVEPARGRDVQVGDEGDCWEDGSRRWYFKDDLTRPIRTLPVPRFSTSIADAWTVYEELVSKGYDVEIGWLPEIQKWGARAVVIGGSMGDVYEAKAPRAICLAALRAVGEDV